MKCYSLHTLRAFKFSVAISLLTMPAVQAQNFWIGAGGTPDWSDPSNWAAGVPIPGDDLTFFGMSLTTNNNDLADNTQYGTITIDPDSGPWVITGNIINVGSNITNNEVTTEQIFGLPMNVVADFTTNVVAGGNLTFNGAISGTGATITKAGAGILNVSAGGNTYSGAWVLNEGTLHFSAGNAIGTGAALTLNGGTLDVTSGSTPGDFTLAANSTLVYNGAANTNVMASSGNTLVSTSPGNVWTFDMTGTGSSQISFGNSAQNVLANFDGTLAFAPGSSSALRFGTGGGGGTFGNISMKVTFGAGSTTRLYARNGGAQLNIGELSGDGGNISSNNGTFTVNIGELGTNSTYGGIFTQSTGQTVVNKNGTGSLTLSGANTHLGNTNVNAGTLYVTGSFSASTIVVSAGGTFGGNGVVVAVNTDSSAEGGKISPGATGLGGIGTITGTDLSWGGSSDGTSATMLFDLGVAGDQSDSIALSGSLTKGTGTKWIFDFGNTGTLGNAYTLISFTSTDFTQADVTSGDLSFINIGPGFVGAGLTVGASGITLSVVPEPSTWALILGGAGLGLAALRRRRAVR